MDDISKLFVAIVALSVAEWVIVEMGLSKNRLFKEVIDKL